MILKKINSKNILINIKICTNYARLVYYVQLINARIHSMFWCTLVDARRKIICMLIWLSLPYLAVNVHEIAEFKLIRDSIKGPLEKLIGRSDLHHEPVVTMQFTYTSWSFHRRNLNSAQETKDLSFGEWKSVRNIHWESSVMWIFDE